MALTDNRPGLDDDALTRALIMAGLGMMGQPNGWQALARGGMFGMQGYDQALDQKDKRRVIDAKLLEEQQQAEARKLALERQAKMQALISGSNAQQVAPAGSQRSVVDAPEWQPRVQAPAQPQGGNVAQMLLNAGFVKEAEDYAKAQGNIHGEAYGGIQVTKSGKPYYMTKQGPRYVEDQSFVPREELHFADTGDRAGVGLDKFTGEQVSKGVQKGMSAAERDAASRGWATFGLDKQRFDRGDLRADIPLPSGGTGMGFVTPKGADLVPGTGEKVKDVPATIQQALAGNTVTLAKIDRALDLVEQQPGAFGLKNVLGDTVRQRTNPEGIDARALVADIGSQKLHDRSGAAVTVSEAPRLTPFIPNVNDKPETVKKKLEMFRKEYADMNDELQRGHSINKVAMPNNMARGKVGEKLPSGAEIEAELMRRRKAGG